MKSRDRHEVLHELPLKTLIVWLISLFVISLIASWVIGKETDLKLSVYEITGIYIFLFTATTALVKSIVFYLSAALKAKKHSLEKNI